MAKPIDLSALSLPELRALSGQVAEEIAKRSETEKAALLAEFQERAKASGFSLSDLLSATGAGKAPKPAKGGKPAAAVPPKYRNPRNPSETWAGRGRSPTWVKAHTDAGGKLEELLIEPAA